MMEMALRRMAIENAAVTASIQLSGLASNVSSFPREVVMTALAHVISDQAEQAFSPSAARMLI